MADLSACIMKSFFLEYLYVKNNCRLHLGTYTSFDGNFQIVYRTKKNMPHIQHSHNVNCKLYDIVTFWSPIPRRHQPWLFGNFFLSCVKCRSFHFFSWINFLGIVLWVMENIQVIWTKRYSEITSLFLNEVVPVNHGLCL